MESVVAGALVQVAVQKLCGLLTQKYDQLQGVKVEVTTLQDDLRLLSSFLKDADAKKHSSVMVKDCIDDIKEIIYDAEDVTNTFLLNEELGKTFGFGKRVKKFAFIIKDRNELASNIENISKRISGAVGKMVSFGVQKMVIDGGRYSHTLDERQREMRQEFSKDYESNLVGLGRKVKKLVGYFVEEDNMQVVSITGMGGVGKTTLAKHVFNHEMIKHKFDGHAWVCVSQDFTRKSVWQSILLDLTPHEDEKKIMEMTESTLHDKLSCLLETSNSLVVLDDLWKEEDWDRIKPIFPPRKGWNVLITSRNESVGIRFDSTFFNFKSECLSVDESWTLFQLIAFPKKDASEFMVVEEMEEMGKEMIKHCGGLPLAIKVLGG